MPLETTRRRPPDYDRKRRHVLAAAARVFCAVGYEKASMRRIAAEAEASLAGIYHYIDGKEELLHAIQLRTFRSLSSGLESCLQGIVDPRERLGAAVRNHVRHLDGNLPELTVCTRELETLVGDAHAEVHELRQSYFEAVHDLVKELRPRGKAPIRSWLATVNLFGMLGWLCRRYDAERTRMSLDDLAAQQTALFLDGHAASASHDDGGNA